MPFEALRDRSDAFLAARGKRPQVTLLPLGPVAENNARATFAANLLASGGIFSLNPGPLAVGDGSIAAAIAASGDAMVVVCGSDKRYGADGAAAIAEARAAGAQTVLLAGAAKALGANPVDTPDRELKLGINAIDALDALLSTLETTGAK
jgi:methylmalonyl-CoA mutase